MSSVAPVENVNPANPEMSKSPALTVLSLIGSLNVMRTESINPLPFVSSTSAKIIVGGVVSVLELELELDELELDKLELDEPALEDEEEIDDDA